MLAPEKKHKSVLYDEHSIHKIEMITKNVGMVYSGMGPDYRSVITDSVLYRTGLQVSNYRLSVTWDQTTGQ